MKRILFQKGTFLTSAARLDQCPKSDLPEIAFIGRSNVGKSSLINHLLGVKKLAKVSNTPGKTQLLNFFTIDDRLFLVDLPGYGFAKVSKKLQENWSESIEAYLHDRKSLKLLLVLLDLNRLPNTDDFAFIEWALHFKKPILVVFTKIDKLNQKELSAQTKKNLEALKPFGVLPYVHYSIKSGHTRSHLIQTLNKLLQDAP